MIWQNGESSHIVQPYLAERRVLPLIRTVCRDDLARLKNKVGRPAAGRKPYEKMMKILEGKKNDSEEVLFNKQKFLNTPPPVINIC